MGKIYQVIVLGLKGEKYTIDVADTEEKFNATTVLEVKKKIMLKIPGSDDPDDIRVIFGKNQLEDAAKFSEHQINHMSTIMIVVRLEGGLDSYTTQINSADN